jgi:hypothetical protein
MTSDDWFAGQMRMLTERVERFAGMLQSQLSVAESLIEHAESWFSPTPRDVRPTETAPATAFAPEAPESSSLLSPLVHGDEEMRSVEEIVAEAQIALDSPIREAFAAGQRQVASDLRRKMEALFEGLAEGGLSHSGAASAHSEAHSHAHQESHNGD